MADPSPEDFVAEPAPPVDVDEPSSEPLTTAAEPTRAFVAPEDVPFGNEPTGDPNVPPKMLPLRRRRRRS
jgi:hypothetical protein